jgi:hypothetical protein
MQSDRDIAIVQTCRNGSTLKYFVDAIDELCKGVACGFHGDGRINLVATFYSRLYPHTNTLVNSHYESDSRLHIVVVFRYQTIYITADYLPGTRALVC